MSEDLEQLLKENEEIDRRRREAERIAEHATSSPASKQAKFFLFSFFF